jgi:hypothetical protein
LVYMVIVVWVSDHFIYYLIKDCLDDKTI